MQKDMHYYGTYAMAKAAGIPENHAAVIAYAAQFVDDSTRYDSIQHDDKGLLFGITTAHHPAQSLVKGPKDHLCGLEEARKIWVPFHFFPGGNGESLEEKTICIRDGALVKQMLDNHLEIAIKKKYRFELLGICAHVYQDTFSHYGFSGLPTDYNEIDQDTINTIYPKSLKSDIADTITKFKGFWAEFGSNDLGHGGGATFPDEPYLHWEFKFTKKRPANGKHSDRNNPKRYLESLESLHGFFTRFAKEYYTDSKLTPFTELEQDLRELIAIKGDLGVRCKAWERSALTEGVRSYYPEKWEDEKNNFHKLFSSEDGIDTNIYRFHQAAAYHRYYVLKDLLPEHGIAVY